jgi:hypothetical protein
MGCETITLESLSAYLKAHGHEVILAFDEALFDDKNYLTMPKVASLFSRTDAIARYIADCKPGLIGFTVFTSAYHFRWHSSDESPRSGDKGRMRGHDLHWGGGGGAVGISGKLGERGYSHGHPEPVVQKGRKNNQKQIETTSLESRRLSPSRQIPIRK